MEFENLQAIWDTQNDKPVFAMQDARLLAIVVPMYRERKKHERAQEIFAPSLREELDRGIAQLDFEVGLDRIPRVIRILSLMLIAVMIMNWEAGRAAGDPTPWGQTLVVPFLVFLGGCAGFVASKRRIGRLLARRRALESMRVALDEDAVVLPRK